MEHAASRPQRGTTTRAHVWRSRFRDFFVASASAGVLALLVAYAFAAPTAELTASVGPTIPRAGSAAVVEGRVLAADGSGAEGARVEVERAGKAATTATTGVDGAFRVQLRGACSVYAIALRTEVDGSPVETRSRRRLCPGDSLPIVARVITHGHFLWVPGPR